MLACSSAQRLKPEGIYVSTEIDVKNWFLAPPDDLRSSNMMEIVASEFKFRDWKLIGLLSAGMQIYEEMMIIQTGYFIHLEEPSGNGEISLNNKDIW